MWPPLRVSGIPLGQSVSATAIGHVLWVPALCQSPSLSAMTPLPPVALRRAASRGWGAEGQGWKAGIQSHVWGTYSPFSLPKSARIPASGPAEWRGG